MTSKQQKIVNDIKFNLSKCAVVSSSLLLVPSLLGNQRPQATGIVSRSSYSHALLAIMTKKMAWGGGVFPSQQLVFTVNPIWHVLGIMLPHHQRTGEE